MGWFLNHQYSSSSSSLWVIWVKFGNVFTTFDGIFVWSNVFFQLVAHLDMFIFMPFFSKSKFGVQNHFGNLLKIIWDSGICLYFRLFWGVTWGFTEDLYFKWLVGNESETSMAESVVLFVFHPVNSSSKGRFVLASGIHSTHTIHGFGWFLWDQCREIYHTGPCYGLWIFQRCRKKQILFLGLAGSGFAQGGWNKEKKSSPNGGDSMMMYDGRIRTKSPLNKDKRGGLQIAGVQKFGHTIFLHIKKKIHFPGFVQRWFLYGNHTIGKSLFDSTVWEKMCWFFPKDLKQHLSFIVSLQEGISLKLAFVLFASSKDDQ